MKSEKLSQIPTDERMALLGSAAKTYTRAAYHKKRFEDIRRELDTRRDVLPGEVIWDALLEYLHFELQGFAGACRTLLDELVYIAAHRHGVISVATKRSWQTAILIKEPLSSECDVPEVLEMRKLSSWFDTLNAYRNTFFHHGWRHGSGHFAPEDLRVNTGIAAANGLLVPDRNSLVGRTKPFEWQWTSRTTVDDVVLNIRDGMEKLLDGILEGIWLTPIPDAGSAPLDERPNVLVGLVKPVCLETDSGVFLPLFTSHERGTAYQLPTTMELELVDAKSTTIVVQQRAVTLSLSGLERTSIPNGVAHVGILLDPTPGQPPENQPLVSQIDISELLAKGSINPISLVVPHIERLWLWRQVIRHPWV